MTLASYSHVKYMLSKSRTVRACAACANRSAGVYLHRQSAGQPGIPARGSLVAAQLINAQLGLLLVLGYYSYGWSG